jgi:hypothetical protein
MAQASRSIALDKIISIQPFLDAVEVAVENRQKNVVFTVPNPYIADTIIHVLRKEGTSDVTVPR